jgi:hypothetical protein
MGAKKQTIGFRYFFSIHMGLGRGPINEIAEIRVGDLTAYDSVIPLKESGSLVSIRKPELFGGEKKEGGIDGGLYCYNGAADQELQGPLQYSAATGVSVGFGGGLTGISLRTLRTLPAIASQLGGDVPNFRGVVTLWFDGMVAAMNPYPKEWSFRVRRWDAGWYNDDPWYPAKARILIQSENGGFISAMNPAHILYEVNTNPEWGRGIPVEFIDENSFVQAANTLCEEGLGLCIPWFRQESINDFIPMVINHIGAVQYVDRQTGKLTLRLIREDYDVNDLPLFTPETGLLDLIDDDAGTEETSFNEIVVKGFDPTTKEDIMVRVHNLAAIQSQGEIISNTVEFRGLPTRNLCARVALRELKVQLPLRKMTVLLDRRGWRIAPGMPFRVSDPAKGISNMILRAGEVRDGTLEDSRISVKAVQDVFGMPQTEFIAPPSNIWTPPNFVAAASPETLLYEMNWRDFYRLSSTADQDAVDAATSYVAILAKAPAGVQAQGFDVLTSLTSEEYPDNENPTVGFTNWLTLLTSIGPLDDELTVAEANLRDFLTEFEAGMAVLVNDEQMEFTTFDSETRVATIKRGVADTIPAAHAAESTIWLIDDEIGSDGIEYQDGETVYGKALTRTSTDLLDPENAVEVSVQVDQRLFRPYPPGDLKVNGVSIYSLGDVEYPEPVLTWTHRDRKLQADVLVGHGEGSIGPEAGTTYNVRVYDIDGVTLLREDDVGSGATWTYTTALQSADGSPVSVWIEFESLRDGVASYFHYRFKVVLVSGWGYGWGENWGG